MGNSLRLDRQPGGENLATGLRPDARGAVNVERRRAPEERCLWHREGDRHVTPEWVLHSNFGCCIGTIKKSATYKISGAAQRREVPIRGLVDFPRMPGSKPLSLKSESRRARCPRVRKVVLLPAENDVPRLVDDLPLAPRTKPDDTFWLRSFSLWEGEPGRTGGQENRGTDGTFSGTLLG